MKKPLQQQCYRVLSKIMRISVVHLFIALIFSTISFATDLRGQGILDREVNIKVANIELKKVLNQIEKQIQVKFAYSPSIIRYKQKITIDAANTSLQDLLNEILSPLEISYAVISDRISLFKDVSTAVSIPVYDVNGIVIAFSVGGKVVDDQGQGLPGVNVVEKGTTNGTTTDSDGSYQLEVQNENSIIVFSFIGYAQQEITVGSQSKIDLALVPDLSTLDEIVVIGYGEQKRSAVTGAIASVKAKDIQNLPVRSLAEALQGRVAGLVVTQDDGDPRAAASITLRGPLNTNGRGPLYVVDGMPFIGTGSAFNIQDVENIEILKDASSAAIYGTLGSGGVILVTTKKGQAGKLKINGYANYGVRKIFGTPKFLQRDEYIKAKTAFGYGALFGTPAQNDSLPDTDWIDELYETGKEQNYTVSLSGGSEKSRVYSSFNYNRIDGPHILNSNERFTFRTNTDHTINRVLKVGQTLFISTMTEDPRSGGSALPIRSTPLMSVYDPTNFRGGWGIAPNGFNGANPVASENTRYRRNKDYELNLSAYWELELLKGLKFRNNLGFSQYGREERAYDYNYFTGPDQDDNERYNSYIKRTNNLLTNFILTYNKTIGTDHALTALIGYEARKEVGTDVKALGQKPLFPNPQNIGLLYDGELLRSEGNNYQGERLLSQFARLTYAYKGKYLFNSNIRRDGSATYFGPQKRFGVFPSVELGWRISEEEFMANVPVTNLKLRMSYGSIGNVPEYQYLFTSGYQVGGNNAWVYDYGNGRISGVTTEAKLANEAIQWETVTTTNIGLDGGLINNKLTFSLDFYDRQTRDMIYPVRIPRSAGIGSDVAFNIGEMSNKGIELLLEYRDKRGDFSYGITLTGSYNKNKLIALDPDLEDVAIRGGYTNQAYGWKPASNSEPGQALGQFYGYEVDGIYTDTVGRMNRPKIAASNGYRPQAGDLIYRDINGDTIINDEDRTYIGNPWPKFNYGLNVSLGYKGFDLVMFFNGVMGVDIYNATTAYTAANYNDHNTTSEIFKASFFNENELTDRPRIGSLTEPDQNGNYNTVSSFHVENGSFLKLKNIQVGYTLPQSVVQKVGINTARVFFMANNLFTLTKYSGMDPELGGKVIERGIDYNVERYPRSRLFSLGLNLEF